MTITLRRADPIIMPLQFLIDRPATNRETRILDHIETGRIIKVTCNKQPGIPSAEPEFVAGGTFNSGYRDSDVTCMPSPGNNAWPEKLSAISSFDMSHTCELQ